MRSLYPVSPLHARDSGVCLTMRKKKDRKHKGQEERKINQTNFGNLLGGGGVDFLKTEPKGVYSKTVTSVMTVTA